MNFEVTIYILIIKYAFVKYLRQNDVEETDVNCVK
jgi:hypothetical protein